MMTMDRGAFPNGPEFVISRAFACDPAAGLDADSGASRRNVPGRSTHENICARFHRLRTSGQDRATEGEAGTQWNRDEHLARGGCRP
jgi:hypothetical protein